jgi:hypothetical protein
MQILAIILLIWTFTISISKFLEIFTNPLNLGISAFVMGFLVTLMGIGFGVLAFFLSKYKKGTFVVLGTIGMIFLILFLSYAVMGYQFFSELFRMVVIFGFLFIISTIPMIGIYALLKKQKKAFLASGFGIIFFFFFVRFLMGTFVFSETQIEMHILFLILFILYLEIGSRSLIFYNVVDKMTPNQDIDNFLLKRFNSVFNNYLIIIFSVFILSFFASILLILNSGFITIDEFFGLNLSSVLGILTLVILSIISAVIFWYIIPREKIEYI